MNIKKEVHARIAEKLKREQMHLRNKISLNKYTMKKLLAEQVINKRELAELESLIQPYGH